MDRANAVLDAFLEPVRECLTPEQARRLADFHIDEATQHRIDELASKANEGSLSEEERAEYEGLIEAGDLISILQAKARAILSQR
jgi:hypothetical protein